MKLNELEYHGKNIPITFNLNVMQMIQEEYGTINAWAEQTSGEEPSAKALIFGFLAMINEGIDIYKDEGQGDGLEPMTQKQVGRMISEVGLKESARVLQAVVVDATRDDSSKNA